MSKQKRIVAIHDISCVGKCSLTVALPILSAAGIETSVIPTAVLSTHTGGFTGFTYRDLTEDILPIVDHWKSLNLGFDSLYTGFLGSFEQLKIVSELFDTFKREDNLILVDPVMADNGELYKIFTPDFAKGMAKLCGKADIIVPNITEACFMLDEPYQAGPYKKDYIESLLKKLSDLGSQRVVLTGVYLDNDTLGAATYDKKTGDISYQLSQKVEGYYHGTGDVFASALLSALLHDFELGKAAKIAVDFTVESIKRTKEAGTDIRFGVNFEQSLPNLIKSLDLLD
ncbi:MAG: putative pyridoxal kinase [Oscillospiraceae bacterium]|jgi:pyridoxine kinase|nr:putative pyridoxal kinase [Oscillospiraceae bacterium]